MRRQPKIIALLYDDQWFNLYDRVTHRRKGWTAQITAIHANHDQDGNVTRYHCHLKLFDGTERRAYFHQLRWWSL
jgi:hypothetical protein